MISVLTILGLILRIGIGMKQGTAWFDESFSIYFSSMPIPEMMNLLWHDVHPPLYALVLNIWMSLFGQTLWSARLLSILLGSLLVPVIYFVTLKVADKKTSLLAAVFIAVSPILLFNSVEARMYPLLLILTALSTWQFIIYLKNQKNNRSLYLWGLFSALMLLTHLTAFLSFVVACAFGFYVNKNKGKFLKVAASAFAPFLVWSLVFIRLRMGQVGGEWQLTSSNAKGSVLARFVDFFAWGVEPWARGIIAIVLVLAFITAMVAWKRSKEFSIEGTLTKNIVLWYLMASALLPLLVFMSLHSGTIKYFFVALPAAVILVSIGLLKLFKDYRIIIFFALILTITPIGYLLSERRIQWDTAMNYIESNERPGDVIYQSWYVTELSMKEYYHGSLQTFGAYPYDKSLSFNERIVRHAGQIKVNDQTMNEMEEFVLEAKRVFLITGASNFSEQPSQLWYLQNGWRLVEFFEINEYSPTVLIFENPKFTEYYFSKEKTPITRGYFF